MELTRRSFFVGLGAVSVGLLFARTLGRVLESLERDLVAEQQVTDQQPSAVDIVVVPSVEFRVDRLVVAPAVSSLFAIENIFIGGRAHVTRPQPLPADVFVPRLFDVAEAGTEIRFRVRYVGTDPQGARFTAALIGTTAASGRRQILGIDSGCVLVNSQRI